MLDLREGFRRAAILIGACAETAWLAMVAIGTEGFTKASDGEWVIIAIGAIVVFLVPWAVVRGIGWVVAGFRGRE